MGSMHSRFQEVSVISATPLQHNPNTHNSTNTSPNYLGFELNESYSKEYEE